MKKKDVKTMSNIKHMAKHAGEKHETMCGAKVKKGTKLEEYALGKPTCKKCIKINREQQERVDGGWFI